MRTAHIVSVLVAAFLTGCSPSFLEPGTAQMPVPASNGANSPGANPRTTLHGVIPPGWASTPDKPQTIQSEKGAGAISCQVTLTKSLLSKELLERELTYFTLGAIETSWDGLCAWATLTGNTRGNRGYSGRVIARRIIQSDHPHDVTLICVGVWPTSEYAAQFLNDIDAYVVSFSYR